MAGNLSSSGDQRLDLPNLSRRYLGSLRHRSQHILQVMNRSLPHQFGQELLGGNLGRHQCFQLARGVSPGLGDLLGRHWEQFILTLATLALQIMLQKRSLVLATHLQEIREGERKKPK